MLNHYLSTFNIYSQATWSWSGFCFERFMMY